MCVLLDGNVDGLSFEIFEGKAELIGIVLTLFCELEVGKHVLKLMEEVVIHLLGPFLNQALGLTIISHQNQTAEALSHKELLHHGDHIADAS